MTLSSPGEHELALKFLYNSGGHLISIIPHTLIYGIYLVLIPGCSYVMLCRGLATRAQKVLFGLIIFMFLLSTTYWLASISTLIQLFQAWFLSSDPDTQSPPRYIAFFSAIVAVNFVLTDGVVIWRAWVLCSVDGTKALVMCFCIYVLATISVIATIAIRIALMIINTRSEPVIDRLTHGINVTQVGTLILSVLTNSLATSLISIKAWRNRDEIRDDLDATADIRSRVGKTFALLIETGVLYTLSCPTLLIAMVIPLKVGTLGDIYRPVNAQLALIFKFVQGIYPVVVFLLITQNQSLDRTIRVFASDQELAGFDGTTTRQLESTMQFERRSVISIGSDRPEADTSHRRGHSKHHQSFLPPIPSAKITWGDVRESI
ncbi:hypothetical protein GYMLUDRAFT_84249 [Collybiopsis luxurians FD-317 M1]|uniref:Uncharacterized protein n=1 Tax=Collybiopsis luxurians FD-317 M1 TaxID=944289 RepID=A0A0D0CJ56_9AGAR|nr:hypothetical protein GYMLUDRAFT_84249 [Collybiopsis luxurians FD-317 M1]